MSTLAEKREALGRDWEAYKAFLNTVPKDGGTQEQIEEMNRRDAAIDKQEAAIKAQMAREEADRKMADREVRYNSPKEQPYRPSDFGDQGDGTEKAKARQLEVFSKFLLKGPESLSHQDREDYMRAFPKNSMVAGQDAEGGYLVVPEQIASQILQAADDLIFIRQIATVEPLTEAASLGVVRLDQDISDYEWSAELGTGTEDSGLTFGKRSLTPHPLAKRIKISRTLLRNSSKPIASIVQSRLSYKLGVTQEKHYMTGNGHNQPLGLFVASADGINTDRDVVGSNTATEIAGDTLIDMQTKLKGTYSMNAYWLFPPDAIGKIRKLKDATNGQYLWQPGLQAGMPNLILGKPYITSEFAPNVFTASKYVGLYGDFSYYWIVDALNMQLQVLNELYAEKNQIGYIVRYEGDGQPVMSEAFVRMQMHA